METIEIIRNLCKENGITISRLEKNLGYGNTSLSRAKNISSNRIVEIANYFHVSVDYILGISNDPDYRPDRLTVDISNIVDLATKQYEKDHTEKLKDNAETTSGIFNAQQIADALNIYADITSHSTDPNEIERALNFISAYQQASPEIQAAIDTLLKASQSQTS